MRGDLLELHDALGIGHFVNAVDRGTPACFQVRGHRLIGGQHELLDERCAMLRGDARHAGHGAALVELDQRLGQIEIDGAAADALAIEDQGQFLHQLEALDQRRIALAQRRRRLRAAGGRWCTSCARRCG